MRSSEIWEETGGRFSDIPCLFKASEDCKHKHAHETLLSGGTRREIELRGRQPVRLDSSRALQNRTFHKNVGKERNDRMKQEGMGNSDRRRNKIVRVE
jgi:hypothetical protein